MKHYFGFIIFLLLSINSMSQNLFKVVETKRTDAHFSHVRKDSMNKYFRIILNNNLPGVRVIYPIIFPKEIDTLKAIAELLTYEGDIRPCAFPINNYNPARSQIYLGKEVNYLIQVEALFIIDQLVYKRPFNYASYPVLVNRDTKEESSIDGGTISSAFKAYKNWYRIMEGKGVDYVKRHKIMPLDGSKVRWY